MRNEKRRERSRRFSFVLERLKIFFLEQVEMVSDAVNVEATRAARQAEDRAAIAEYRARRRTPDAEELAEMRAAFGEGATVVDVLTGEKIKL